MKPTLFYEMIEFDQVNTASMLANALLEYEVTTDRKFGRSDHLKFEFSERIWPKPDSSKD
ncbi:MAG: hypothetical protein ACK47F_00560 [Flavobacteriales bacterium]